ncbi:hypothetical protein AB6D20_027530 (plasmid) [Vibrio splendidus]
MHSQKIGNDSQKIGNALRTLCALLILGMILGTHKVTTHKVTSLAQLPLNRMAWPIAIEPYGSVTNRV